MKKGREFVVSLEGKERTLHFRNPTQRDLFDLDLEYRKIYAEALRQGAMTEAEARKHYRKNGAWGDAEETTIQALTSDIAALSLDLENEKISKKKKMEIVSRMSEKRAQLIELIGTKNEMLSNTAEGLSSEQKMHKLTELCCYEGDSRFFPDRGVYESFVLNSPDILSIIYREAYMFEYDVPEDITESWQEIQYIKSLEEKKPKKRKK